MKTASHFDGDHPRGTSAGTSNADGAASKYWCTGFDGIPEPTEDMTDLGWRIREWT